MTNVILDKLRGRRALVTGGTGFIGAHLVRALLKAGCEVAVLVRPQSDLWRLGDEIEKVEIVIGDLAQPDTLSKLNPYWASDLIFHLGSAGVNQSYTDAQTIITANVNGTLSLLKLAEKSGSAQFVYCGSCFEYGGGERLKETTLSAPTSIYAASKAAAWILTQTYGQITGLPVVSMRLFTVYGPFESPTRLIPHTILSALSGQEVRLTGGEQTRDLIYVEDVIDAFMCVAGTDGLEGQVLNICTGQSIQVKEVAALILELMNNPVNLILGAIPYRDNEMWTLSGDPTHTKDVLGWKARFSLQEGLAKMVPWLRQNYAMMQKVWKTN